MKHLHDILGMKISDYEAERLRLEALFMKARFVESEYTTFETTLKDMSEAPFRTSKMRGTSISIDDFMNRCEPYWHTASLEGLLLYCEILFNIAICANDVIRRNGDALELQNQLCGNIVEILEKTGHEIQKEENGLYYVVQKNAIATDVIKDLDDKHLAVAILEYNRFSLKGDIERKRELLNTIGQAIAPIAKDKLLKEKCPEVFDDVNFALNRLNIRHNNTAGKHEQPAFSHLSKTDVEVAYDDLYASMLILIKVSQYRDGHTRMEKLKKAMIKA